MLRFRIKNANGDEKFVNAGLAIHGSSRSGGYLALEVDGNAVCFISPKGELIVNLPIGIGIESDNEWVSCRQMPNELFPDENKDDEMTELLAQIEKMMAFYKGVQIAMGLNAANLGHNTVTEVLSFILKDLQGIYEAVGNKINGDN